MIRTRAMKKRRVTHLLALTMTGLSPTIDPTEESP